MHEALAHIHLTTEEIASVELSPPHAPRIETPAYHKAHHSLVVVQDTPCVICGVRQSTLADPACNTHGATQMETHHFPIERSLMNACDYKKVQKDFPQVVDQAAFEAFIDSPSNLVVLCDIHHRHPFYGIHHLPAQDFYIQKYLYTGYIVACAEKDATTILAADEQLLPIQEEEHDTHSTEH